MRALKTARPVMREASLWRAPFGRCNKVAWPANLSLFLWPSPLPLGQTSLFLWSSVLGGGWRRFACTLSSLAASLVSAALFSAAFLFKLGIESSRKVRGLFLLFSFAKCASFHRATRLKQARRRRALCSLFCPAALFRSLPAITTGGRGKCACCGPPFISFIYQSPTHARRPHEKAHTNTTVRDIFRTLLL